MEVANLHHRARTAAKLRVAVGAANSTFDTYESGKVLMSNLLVLAQ
jgi:hypothetical protein